MNDIEYREFRNEDSSDIKGIINEAFYIYRYAEGKLVLDSALELYLRERLLASTWTRVAVKDGRVVGVVMAQVAGEQRLPGRLRNKVLSVFHIARAATVGIREWKSMRQYFAFNQVYSRLRERAAVPLTDELTLFAVSSSMRGQGVGSVLYQDCMDHLRRHGRSEFYLYTDSLCTFQFYEKKGMNRAAEETMNLVFVDGTPEALGVYLYTGALPQA